MAQLLPLQKFEAVSYNGLVTDNHFHALYQQKPELISKVIKEIYKVNLQGKLREFVDRFPTKEVEQENGFYNWMLQGQHNKNLPLPRLRKLKSLKSLPLPWWQKIIAKHVFG